MRLFIQAAMVVICFASVSLSSLAVGQSAFFAGTRNRSARSATPTRTVAPVVTQNFIVNASDPLMAQKVAREAERFRKKLAIDWLGHELGPWESKCPITVEIGQHAGGETSFAFVANGSEQSRPVDWQMKIFGPPDRILDAVLPHEITHTIFATHFGQPLPRWADEGACTTVEHQSERSKNHRMLIEFLTSSPARGIPFNRMFEMKNYPNDILPLYAQGYSLARFLILQKGRRHFLDFVESGMKYEVRGPILKGWNQATHEYYGYKNLSDLQVSWLDWVKKGSSEDAFLVVSSPVTDRNFTDRNSKLPMRMSSALADGRDEAQIQTFARANSGSWYARQMNRPESKQARTGVDGVSSMQARKIIQPSPGVQQRVLIGTPRPGIFPVPPSIGGSSRTIWR